MIDHQLQALMKQAAASGAPDFADLPPTECRAFFKEFITAVDAPHADVIVTDRTIAGPGGELPLRILQPKGQGKAPLLLYFHGGGWVIGGPDEYQGMTSNLCEQSGCVVVVPDYRLAPEHPFPAAVEDCYAALEWAAEHAAEIGADPDRIAVAGDSAGGNLATVCALLARDGNGPKISFQGLVYPVTSDMKGDYPSYRKHGEGHLLTARSMAYFKRHYLGADTEVTDFRAAPMLANDLSGLPPALVMVAGFDPLHDEGIAYAEKMGAAGVHVMVSEYPTLAHAFISMSGAIDCARLCVSQLATAVRNSLTAA